MVLIYNFGKKYIIWNSFGYCHSCNSAKNIHFSEEIKKQSLVHLDEENISSSITDRNYMPDEPGITLDNRNEEVKELKFHSYYSDGMVFQRDTQNNIWGYSISAQVSAKFSCQ